MVLIYIFNILKNYRYFSNKIAHSFFFLHFSHNLIATKIAVILMIKSNITARYIIPKPNPTGSFGRVIIALDNITKKGIQILAMIVKIHDFTNTLIKATKIINEII